jgi:hypothetical protein
MQENNASDFPLPDFGVMVTVTARMKKTIYGVMRGWEEIPFYGTGIYLGVRRISSGYVYNSRGDKAQKVDYKTTSSSDVALVAMNAKSNPIYVPLTALTI